MKHTLFILSLLLTSMSLGQTVTIGTQVWMTKNLDVATFRNGDPIPEAKSDEEWKKAGDNKQPAWCYYDNNPANGAKYGKLYNWYAVNDPRGLAPEGYHIPSHAEWTKLKDFLGTDAGKKMKSTSGWYSNEESVNGTNSSGFSGLPGGHRHSNGAFYFIGYYGHWWSSTQANITPQTAAKDRWLCWSQGDLNGLYELRENGFSVRCIKD